MKIKFLGTSSMVPTKDRNHTSILLTYNAENILIDCGEGTQRQLKIANINPCKITKILLTHMHGDHTLGIPGLIQTLGANNYQKTLEIYGPKNTKNFINNILKTFHLENKIKLNVTEIDKKKFLETKEFYLEALPVKHSTYTLAYSFIEKDKRKINLNYTKKFNLTKHPLLGELQKGKDITFKGKKITADKATILKKGKKISFIFDTELTQNCIEISKNADLLIAEATYESDLEEKAKEYKHLTSEQSAIIAKKAKVNALILTHFSQRYKTPDQSLKEAKKIFKNTQSAKDFLEINM